MTGHHSLRPLLTAEQAALLPVTPVQPGVAWLGRAPRCEHRERPDFHNVSRA
jgi:hypothetical protein